MEALQPQPQHSGVQEQAGDESPGVPGAGQVGREDYNNTIEIEYISIYFMQDISEPRGGMTLLAR